MTFRLKLVISSPVSEVVKQAVLRDAASLWPFTKRPTEGFMSRPYVVNQPRQEFLAEHAHFAVDERHDVRGNHSGESIATELSNRFSSLVFAFIEAECFGGDCDYQGSVWQSGQILHREVFGDDDQLTHRRLLEHVGISLPDGYFAPFLRGYFDDG